MAMRATHTGGSACLHRAWHPGTHRKGFCRLIVPMVAP